jgi:hypothetical protein
MNWLIRRFGCEFASGASGFSILTGFSSFSGFAFGFAGPVARPVDFFARDTAGFCLGGLGVEGFFFLAGIVTGEK